LQYVRDWPAQFVEWWVQQDGNDVHELIDRICKALDAVDYYSPQRLDKLGGVLCIGNRCNLCRPTSFNALLHLLRADGAEWSTPAACREARVTMRALLHSPEELTPAAADCHLRPVHGAPQCTLCNVDRVISKITPVHLAEQADAEKV
jgi:hypothetical protein